MARPKDDPMTKEALFFFAKKLPGMLLSYADVQLLLYKTKSE